MGLARSFDGKTVHRWGCRHARVRWSWADRHTIDELFVAVAKFGYRLCRVCQPLGGLDWAPLPEGRFLAEYLVTGRGAQKGEGKQA